MHKLSAVPEPHIQYQPKHYWCKRAEGQSDWSGKLDQPFWEQASWTDSFVDIEGDIKLLPSKQTRVKMLWDDDYFYIGAELEDNEIWATQTERDSVIFYDNDFEVFIDPDGDTHQYYEFEINALNTVWDLLLVKPYRDEGPAINGWDMSGLRTAVYIDGELNNPLANNRKWSVEIAMPWSILKECSLHKRAPIAGEHWRVNFSRVQWQVDIIDDQYVKRIDPATGRSFPEDNWVWSPMGIVNMHYPELWGYVIFTDEKHTNDTQQPLHTTTIEQYKWLLRQLYYRQRQYASEHQQYCDQLSIIYNTLPTEIQNIADLEQLRLETTSSMFQISIAIPDGQTRLCIRQDGWVWAEA